MTAQQKKIIKTASKIIEKDGIEKLTMRKLAKQAKLHPNCLYQNFENKNEILKHVAKSMTDDVLSETRFENKNAKEQLIFAVSAFLKRLSEQPHVIDFVFFNKDIDQILPEDSISIPNHFIGKINAAINERPSNKQVDTQNLFIRILSTIHGLAMMIKQGMLAYHPQLAEVRLAYI
ncbi:hypothetical protein GCM10022297_10100 [Lactobacillus hamsteri]|uniref:HTH tetR-type domain-containing protein n=1 Tax=Lactobacillus hamsteri DSM 5661 = JCM 6256 TaxID=1423754 RepID=A0A0R1YEW9_9LACO|nr:TetR/AcrR family transcriptional regulator [Lactobacillus hamsteri]KRM41032.1 hypothetical protein FC39_GL001676 [Lactobacillus hamsteri DSM 5661 = JCM 6256]